MAVKFSHADIADNESIQDYTAVRYKTLSNIIEYGADHTLKAAITPADREKYSFLKKPYAFKVCRIEPENNIAMVLGAFSKLPKLPMVMVGNWNNSEYGIEIRKQYSMFSNITLLDPIYDQRELDVLRGNCYVYVHGHSAGGTNPSLVEAMYLGLPIMVYGVSYNKTTTEGKALYFRSEEELHSLLITKKITDLKKIAEAMKEIAYRRYTWKLIADKYEYMIFKALVAPRKNGLTTNITKKLSAESLIHYELGHLRSPTFFYEKR
jgi:glycosyltransferase involved in cell wall biosynthesis